MPTVMANGVDLYYEEHGSGPPLLLIPPTAWPGSVWDIELVPRLRGRFRTIAYDQRGIGRSSIVDAPYTTALLAQDALALLHALDAAPAHVFGFSTGGQVAQVMALDEPAAVRSMVLGGSNARGPGGGVPFALAARLIEEGYGGDYWLRHLTDTDFPFSRAFRDAHPDTVRALADAIDRRKPPLRTYLRHLIVRGEHDARGRLGDIRTPTLVLVGGEDRRRGEGTGSDHMESAHLLAREIPNAELIEVGRAHHLFAWEEPDETARIVTEFFLRH
ncbi:MAG: alpha/beta fold hydrolase [Chloroflexota bacterium]|nr:alpha/beta fold hydrolase [Chloroflexota bacterium]MDE3194457.1 alpha/beta fold hydrolase [Chloroflexota bacterium]